MSTRMPTSTPGSEQQGSSPNPSVDDYRQKFEEGNFEDRIDNTPSQDDVEKGINDLEGLANGKGADSKPIREQEAAGDHSIPSTFSGKNNKENIVKKITLKKAAPLLGGGGIIGIIIFLLGGWMPTMLVPALGQGSIAENDSRSTVLERRLLAKIRTKMSDTSGPCATKNAMCLNKKMPKTMLDSMAKKGIVPLDGSNPIDTKGRGYVDKNPTHYQFTDRDGKLKTISADKFLSEYKDNPVFRKTFKKAWNMRYVSYASNLMRKALGKWGVKPNGGKAGDNKFTEKSAQKMTSDATKAGNEKLEGERGRTTFKDRTKSLLRKAGNNFKKSGGDFVLAIGSGMCMAIGMPTFIAGTVRAVQLAQVMVLASDFILSAGDMVRSGDAKPEQVSGIGNTLTGRYSVEGSTELKSAVDSAILLAAVGAATKSTLKPNKLMPGYSMFSNKAVQGASAITSSTKDACAVINSPQAGAASLAFTAILAAIPVVGDAAALVKIALQLVGKLAVSFGAVPLLLDGLDTIGFTGFIANAGFNIIKDIIGNQYTDVKGVQLGDALGAGIFATLSIGALAGGAAVLTKGQARGFKKVSDAIDEQYKQEDIATLSPFDASSRYTFLGSIVSKLAVSSAGSSNAVTSTLSTLGTIISSPLRLLGNSASAEVDPIEAKFGYAADYGVDPDIGVTVAGTPATGLPTNWLDMDTTEAETRAANSFDPDTGKPFEPSAALDIGGTFSGMNANISTMLADCGDADLESLKGCTIDPKDSAQSAAEHIYYMDYGLERVLNGEDAAEGKGGGGAQPGLVGKPDGAIDSDRGWILADGVDYSKYACDARTTDAGVYTNPDRGFTVRLCTVNFNGSGTIASVISTNTMNMFEAARGAGVELGISDGMRRDTDADYSSYTIHKYGTAMDLGAPKAGSTICFGGDPRFGYGSKANAEAACSAKGGVEYQAYQWLQANAAGFGFFNYEVEPWHWSSSGG